MTASISGQCVHRLYLVQTAVLWVGRDNSLGHRGIGQVRTSRDLDYSASRKPRSGHFMILAFIVPSFEMKGPSQRILEACNMVMSLCIWSLCDT